MKLETRWLTAAYWGAVLLQALAFFVPRFPPLVDYPQHLAIASVLHRWMSPGSPERAIFDANFFTYNGAFHTLAALLGFVVPMETAGKVVLALIPALVGWGGLTLVRAARRPRSYAFFLLPLSLSAMVTWGFLNNVLSYAVGLGVLGWMIRGMRGERGYLARAAAGGLVVAYLHIFGAFILCATTGLLALRRLVFVRRPWRERLRRFAWTLLALAPAPALSLAFVLHNRSSSHSNWENAMHDGWDDYAWRKALWLPDFVFGNFADHSDRNLCLLLFAGLAFLYFPRPGQGVRKTPRGLRDFRFLAGVFVLLYLITPRVLFATWFIFERVPFFAISALVCGAPVLAASSMGFVRTFAAGLALSAGANAVAHHANIPEEGDADAILDAIPEGARVVGLIWEPSPLPVLVRQTYVHMQAYHLVRHRGDMTVSFAMIESLPVHFKAESRPPRREVGAEWTPESYDPDSAYGRHFETVLVHAPSGTGDPTSLVFQEKAHAAQLLARHGRFFLYRSP